MNMTDYVRFCDVKEGDILIADGGFTCMKAGPKEVMKDEKGELYVKCRAGRHYLDGQLDSDNSQIIGMRKHDS